MWELKDTSVMLATATSYIIGTNQIYINVLTVNDMAIQIGIKKSMPWHVGEQRQSYASNRLLTRLLEQPSMFYHYNDNPVCTNKPSN